jgi:SAM-dependent methyltransferase
VRCAECGTAATTGSAPGPSAYTSGIYSPTRPRLGPLVRALQRAAVRLPLRMLGRAGIAPGAAVLDAGAGRGRLLAALRRGGYRAEGIDPSPRAPEVTRATLGEHEARGLDAVVLWHVLEHVDDPAAAVRRAGDWLASNGVLLIALPNVASLQAGVGGPVWFHLDVPRHRTHFSPRGLRTLLERSGFRVEAERHFVAEHNPLGMWLALLTRLGMTPGFPFHVLKRNTPVTAGDVALLVVAGPLLAVPALLLELAGAALRRGGTVAVLARRQADA